MNRAGVCRQSRTKSALIEERLPTSCASKPIPNSSRLTDVAAAGGQLDSYLPYLQERWNAGCHNGMKLWRELRERGYTGSASSVRPYIALLRQAPGQPLSLGSPFEKRLLVSHRSPQQIAWLALRPVEHLTDKEQTDLTLFCQEHAQVRPAISLAQSFASMMRDRSAEALDDWVTEAQASPFSELRTFATGVARDKAAVTAATFAG
jgi:transposase